MTGLIAEDPADIVREALRRGDNDHMLLDGRDYDRSRFGDAVAALDAIESELKGLRVLASLVSGVLCDAGTIPVAACDDVEGLHRGLRELLAERDGWASKAQELREQMQQVKKLASDPFASEAVSLRVCLLTANEALGLPGPQPSPARDIARAILTEWEDQNAHR